MPGEAKPYLEREWYISRAGGEYVRLCRKEEGMALARKLLREHLVRRNEERPQQGGPAGRNLTVAELFALFLEAVKVERSEHTYVDYQRWLTEFAKQHGRKKARDITRGDANDFNGT